MGMAGTAAALQMWQLSHPHANDPAVAAAWLLIIGAFAVVAACCRPIGQALQRSRG